MSTGGGFIPPISSPTPSSTSSATPSTLPRQRSHPLRPGSLKESTLINHLDKTLLSINRRHAKKFSSRYENPPESESAGTTTESAAGPAAAGQSERGYESFSEVVGDVEPVVDLVWVSGTRMYIFTASGVYMNVDTDRANVATLQIPYLISLAVLLNTCLPSYPFAPRSTFRVLRKLDSIFASLLTGVGVEAEAEETPLAGFENRRDVVSMTEKVRIKSVAEGARVVVFGVRQGEEDNEDSGGEGEEEGEDGSDEDEGGVGRWEMEAARVYERTIQLLGDEFGRVGGVADGDGGGCG